ncbi:hypothetical protein [Cytobacillus purgationiresistens]|uniref:DUF1657 domain-containing protein n=1 Tax=Cytobacillus purgationiresistens TaxID=863449 RepID=A0ABU0AJY0_9BACI|nr:hypothetical protein [Cytobacillus purgationiresistens]MDQ0271026.1 hypothetical protein [Cytobacillus purgationiresistens]
MKDAHIDFNKIMEAVNGSIEAVKDEQNLSSVALDQLKAAQQDIQHALSFSLSRTN